MSDPINKNNFGLIVNTIKNPIITHSDAVAVFSGKFYATKGPRIVTKVFDFYFDAVKNIAGEFI